MFEILGWLLCGLALAWASILVFFITVPTFSDALFSSKHWYCRVFGALLWIAAITLWILWLSVIEINT